MENDYFPFVNLPLPYNNNAMEPFIDEKTMQLHHDKHLQTYINNLNDALKDYPGLQRMSLKQLMRASRMPYNLQTTIRNNAGGVYNHRFFFDLLQNPALSGPEGILLSAITQSFGNYNNFRNTFIKAALSVFGSGYAWLVYDRRALDIITTPNQNSPIEYGMCPILCIDVWEHAYYLKHYNVRADYIADFLKIINWDQVEQNYIDCL